MNTSTEKWMPPRLKTATFCLGLILASVCSADGPKDNDPKTVRRVPRLGIDVSAADRKELQTGLDRLAAGIDAVRKSSKQALIAGQPAEKLLPDVQIFHRAVRESLMHREFFALRDVEIAMNLLIEGEVRVGQLMAGSAPWTTASGLVVRGFVSRIDGTVQPYGLVVPTTYGGRQGPAHRLDIWFHGRGETMSEVKFIDQRQKQVGQYAPAATFVLHPYGRYSNAFKFAGEVDVLEALAAVKRDYNIDDNRVSVRGFSMGGAACWQFAVHQSDQWFAANPGAGFSETPEFLKFFQKETLAPTWYEKKLWHLYDCTDYAANLSQCPTIAYSGEVDIQKQAADIMESELAREGIDLVHVIGPKTGHKIHPDSKRVIEAKMTTLAQSGRRLVPREVHFVTYTLKYNRMNWVAIDQMQEHWRKARVDASIQNETTVFIKTDNVAAMTLEMPAGWSPLNLRRNVPIVIDEQSISAPRPRSDRSWKCQLYRDGNSWEIGVPTTTGLRKKHDLQGPIDDAFMDSFVFVRPTGTAFHAKVQGWVESELTHAITHWRRQFRGDARVLEDTEIGDQEIESMNLVLFGDPSSNSVLRNILPKLPIQWTEGKIVIGTKQFGAGDHIPVLIYPNPLNPQRYVVLNSGFTYREYDYLNNARQVPKLPDWAIVDIRQPPSSRTPGRIADANFFDEAWRVRK